MESRLTENPTICSLPAAPRGWQDIISRKLFLLVILPALWAAAYLPNLGTLDLHHEEGRRAAPARAMLVTGNYIVPTLYGDIYFNKPPGFFWVVAGFGHVLGQVNAWACRLPSALALLLGVFLIMGFARRQLCLQTRVLAGLMLLASIIMLDKARLGEIDVLLSALVFWSMAVWFDGYEPEGQTLDSWLWLGTIMAMAVLLKAPAGPAEFYVTIVAFLLWERQWQRLFSWGHLLALLIMVLPTAAWVALAYLNSRWTFPEFALLWWNQIGGDTVPGQSHAAVPLGRYAVFPWEVFTMLLPWVLWTIPMMIPAVARWLKVDRTVWRFLVCGVGALTLAFWAWPSSRPRHMMAVIYPACILAALFVTQSSKEKGDPRGWRLLAGGANIAAGVLAVLGLGGVLLACHPQILRSTPPLLPQSGIIVAAVVGGVLCLGVAIALWRINARTPLHYGGLSLAVSLAIMILLALGVYNLAVQPYTASIAETRRGWTAITSHIDPAKKLYTTLTLAPCLDDKKPGRGDDFYNIQFYLGTRLRRFPGFTELKTHLAAGEACTVLLLEGEAAQFTAAGFQVHPVAVLPLKRNIEIVEVCVP